ncbi:MAG: hypothetical protein IJK60_05620 [Clostridia bacterium]|nr:hypothetical protein [Clostridia bacterium]
MKTTTKSIYQRTRADLLPAYGSNNELRQEAEELREAHRSDCWSYDRAAAVVIRSHLREQFPECKFSIRSGGTGWLNSVNIELKSAPYEKDGEITKAIVNYCKALHDAFDNDDGDYYADYGAHHDLYGGASVDWQYKQTEPTAEVERDIIGWRIEAAADRMRAEKQAEEEARKREEEAERARAAYEQAEQERRARLAAGIKSITDAPAYVSALRVDVWGKEGDHFEVLEHLKANEQTEAAQYMNASISRVIDLTPDAYAALCDNFLEDWEPVAGFGGYWLDDDGTLTGYCNCVLITVDGSPRFVVDPEGHKYCRYIYMLSAESVILRKITA